MERLASGLPGDRGASGCSARPSWEARRSRSPASQPIQSVSQPILHSVLPSTVWLVKGWMQTPPRCCCFCNTATTTTSSSTSSSSSPPPPLLLLLFPGASCTTSPVRCTLQPVQSPDLQRLERVGGVESEPVDLRLDDSCRCDPIC